MGTKHDDDNLMIDTPYGRKRWGTIRRALDSHDELLEACKDMASYLDLKLLGFRQDYDEDHCIVQTAVRLRAQVRAAMSKAEAPQ